MKAGFAFALLLGTAIALALLSVAPVGAQETTTAEATALQGANKRETPKKSEAVIQTQDVEVVAQTGEDSSTSVVVDTDDASKQTGQTETQAISEAAEDEAQEGVSQQGTQRPPQTASRAADPLAGETVAINVNNDVSDPDSVGPIKVEGCTVASNATVTVDDGDGTRVRLVNDGNVEIEATPDRITITGPDGEEIETQAIQDGEDEGVFSFSTGTVVSSTGIRCNGDDDDGGTTGNDDDGGDGNGGGGGDDDEDAACRNSREVANIGPTSDNSRIPFEVIGRTFRVSYDVTFADSNEIFNSLDIDIEDRFGLVDFEIVEESGRDSFIVTEGPGSFELVVNVEPNNGATYTVTVEDCVEGEVLNDPKKPLPETGGPPLLALAVLGLVSAAVGASVLRAGLRREE